MELFTCEVSLQVPPPHRDKMESFWTGEALKYLFLLLDTSPTPGFHWINGSSTLRLIPYQCKALQLKKLSNISTLARLK